MRLFLIILIHFALLHKATMFEYSTRDGSDVLRSFSQVPSDHLLESLYTMRIRESDELNTVLALYEEEMEQTSLTAPNCQKLKTMVKRCTDQKIRAPKL